MPYFRFNQNNSGGDFTNPWHILVIEANTRESACILAEEQGVYFAGVAMGRDCSCCGDRWSRDPDEYATDPFATEDQRASVMRWSHEQKIRVEHMDGTVNTFTIPTRRRS